jgi:hypothetical protein
MIPEHSRIAWVLATIAATFALVAAAAFLPGARLWGVNHLAYYPVWARLFALAVVGVVFVPAVARRVHAAFLAVVRFVGEGGSGAETILAVCAVGSVALFAGFPSATNLLGDGQLIANNFRLAAEGDADVVARSPASILAGEPVARGATLLYYASARLSTDVLHRAPVDGIRYINCLIGAAFVWLFLGFLRQRELSSDARLWLVVVTLFSSPIELFFGYVENYTPLVFLLALYAASGLSVARGKSRVWVPATLLAVSVFVHVQAILFLPSLALLALLRAGPQRTRVVHHGASVITLLVLAGTIAASFVPRFAAYLLPLAGRGGVFAPAHVVDVVNEALLLSPLLPSLLVMAALTRSVPPGNARAPWLGRGEEAAFVAYMLGPCVVYLLFFRSGIGMARDWDLFTMAIVGIVPATLIVVQRFAASVGRHERWPAVAVPMMALVVVLGVSWVGVNASGERSVERFERILEGDKTHAGYAYENLATYYRLRGDLPRAIERMLEAATTTGNPRHYVFLATLYEQDGEPENALLWCNRALESHPDYYDARLLAASILDVQGRFSELSVLAREGTSQHPGDAAFWFYLGEASIRLGRSGEGVDALRRARACRPGPDLTRRIDALLRAQP